MLNPALIYNQLNNAQTAAAMLQEAQIYDAILASDGSPATIDIATSPGVPLTVNVFRGKPRSFAQSREDEKPTYTEPRRTLDIFAAPRSLANSAEAVAQMYGRTLTFEGTSYTISFVKPHKIAGITLWVELHCDITDGPYLPVGRVGIV